MTQADWLAECFEHDRARLRAVAYRMLGSLSEADDAAQEAWLRISRADAIGVDNLGGWLITVVTRVCLNALRARSTRREEPVDVYVPDPVVSPADGTSPEDEALLDDSVGLALLVVLQTLTPAERLAFVLHDMFDLPFDEIGRPRRRASSPAEPGAGSAAPASGLRTRISRQREVVSAFFAVAHDGDLDAHHDPRPRCRGTGRRRNGAPGGNCAAARRGGRRRADVHHRAALRTETASAGQRGCGRYRDGRRAAVGSHGLHRARGRVTEINAIFGPERLARLDLSFLDSEHTEASELRVVPPKPTRSTRCPS